MRILMFGWEFPPRMSGGLGTACYGITAALAGLGHRITFVLPRDGEAGATPFLDLVSTAGIPVSDADRDDGTEKTLRRLALRPVPSLLHPYLDAGRYRTLYLSEGKKFPITADVYGLDLIAEVIRYGRAGGVLARTSTFDVIHAHDWMTVPAALLARRISGRPLVLHIHSLEYDRSGENVNDEIFAIEREGMEKADRIIAVSHRTKRMIAERYAIPEEKISVVYNAVSQKEARQAYRTERPRGRKMVLFLGRITFQKGPDYFVEAAAQVLRVLPDVTFVMAGAGDMMGRMIERIGALGIGDHFHFTGFLQGEEIERIFSLSDLYVMPSVSEPFGISPLEAMSYDVPVILSRQSGVSEILRHALKVDFWDVREMAAKIIAVLKHPVLADKLAEKAREELRKIRWETAAEKITAIYRETAGR
ncbi:MAG: glycosyltransferase family 4 protein [Proteobacteria bacterium]|nr:glycosyltransferase family 4 protein [Pseudomonadota bacterium]MBU1965261.1 glycosyltransferase family 4 protein [Pseudomonadota bacterium]